MRSRGHPVEGLRTGPVAAQPHLEEPVAAQRSRLDQPAHRLAVPPQRAELDVAGVGVRVEVDHRHAAVAEHVGHALGVGVGDRVVAAEHDGDRACAGHLLDGRLEPAEGRLDVAGRHLDVAGVDDPEVLQRVGAQRQRGPRAVVRQVVGHPDGLRAEARARPVRRATVERRADDHDVRVGVRRLVVEVARRDAEEGDVGAELSAVACHGPTLGSDAHDGPGRTRPGPSGGGCYGRGSTNGTGWPAVTEIVSPRRRVIVPLA